MASSSSNADRPLGVASDAASAASPPRGRSLIEAVRSGVLVLDGAMGTQLYERGVLFNACFEELNVTRPELVSKVHEDYLRAGAQVIETNTYGANALRLEKHGLAPRVRELNAAGVRVARSAAAGHAYVVGALGPSGYFLGDGGPAGTGDRAKVRAVFFEQARALLEAGVDALLIETMRQTPELRLAVEAAVEASEGRVPVIASASLNESGQMVEGTGAEEVARLAREWGASIVGVNCSDGPMAVLAAAEKMAVIGLPVLASPNAGLPRLVDERTLYVSTPEYFGVYAQRMFRVGVRLAGGCCGTTPEHIRRIAASARMMTGFAGDLSAKGEDDLERGGHPSVALAGSVVPPAVLSGALRPTPFAERSELAAKIARGRFVVSVEVSPPMGLDASRAVAAAKSLKLGGVDVVNIGDGARAQARMSNLALAVRVQREAGIEAILHVCGRDRNLLGTIAHLLGAHDLGVKNLVIITGDPPKMGDYPDATAVYDVDSIGILKLASGLNHGVDPGGKPLGSTTGFLLATGAEPAALNYPRELARLREKKNAGAELVMTQPVYSPEVLGRLLDDIAPLELPVLVGLLPLASYRNAEFLHNEVPGMQVPDDIRERMRKAGSGADARKEGVAIAREMLAAVRHRVAGAYVMPPLERYELALEVIDGFLESDMTERALGVALFLGFVLVGGCRRGSVEAAASSDAGIEQDQDRAAPLIAPAVLAARCHPTDGAFVLGDAGALDEVEIGDAITYPGGNAVALVRLSAVGRVAAAALLGADARGPLRVVDLGPTPDDAPPPRLSWRAGQPGGGLMAASYASHLPSGPGSSVRERVLAVQVVSTDAPPAVVLSIPQQRDDSMAFDFAFAGSNGLVVWDEATASRGVVRAAPFPAGAGDVRPPGDVSPPESDAELPRVVPSGSGFLAFWIARRPDPTDVDASDLEATGEERTFGWIEMIAVDSRGIVAGPLRRLTPLSGHVSAYDVQPLSGGAKPALLVIARDDGEAVDGSGGALVRVRVAAGVAEAPTGVPIDGLGRGAPTFVAGELPWLTWIGPHEQLRLLPLDGTGAPAGGPSAEEALSEGRPMLVLPGGRLLVAVPWDAAAQLRTVSCAR